MDVDDRLYVEIHPLKSGQIPRPHPIDDAGFDIGHVYKVLGMYNPSETSECYMVLANPKRQIWFIPQRHLLAYGLLDSSELFLTLDQAAVIRRSARKPAGARALFPGQDKFTDTGISPDLDRTDRRQPL